MNTSFQTTNKTSGKHSLVQKPSAQIRGFSKNKERKLKKEEKEQDQISQDLICMYLLAGQASASLTRITSNNVEK